MLTQCSLDCLSLLGIRWTGPWCSDAQTCWQVALNLDNISRCVAFDVPALIRKFKTKPCWDPWSSRWCSFRLLPSYDTICPGIRFPTCALCARFSKRFKSATHWPHRRSGTVNPGVRTFFGNPETHCGRKTALTRFVRLTYWHWHVKVLLYKLCNGAFWADLARFDSDRAVMSCLSMRARSCRSQPFPDSQNHLFPEFPRFFCFQPALRRFTIFFEFWLRCTPPEGTPSIFSEACRNTLGIIRFCSLLSRRPVFQVLHNLNIS